MSIIAYLKTVHRHCIAWSAGDQFDLLLRNKLMQVPRREAMIFHLPALGVTCSFRYRNGTTLKGIHYV